MVGAIDAEATMTSRLTLRYRTPVADHDQLLAAAGARVTGHEFHRTVVEPASGARPAWLVDGAPSGFAADPAGLGTETLHASYLHLHWAGHPHLAQRFADAVHAQALDARRLDRPLTTATGASPDLRYHGDQDIADGLVDLAVNVRIPTPPAWLQAVIDQTTPGLAGYPRSDEAAKAIAAAHRVALDQVLPTAGGAEAFTLLARALPAPAAGDHPPPVHRAGGRAARRRSPAGAGHPRARAPASASIPT